MTSEGKKSASEPLLNKRPIDVTSIYKLYPDDLK